MSKSAEAGDIVRLLWIGPPMGRMRDEVGYGYVGRRTSRLTKGRIFIEYKQVADVRVNFSAKVYKLDLVLGCRNAVARHVTGSEFPSI